MSVGGRAGSSTLGVNWYRHKLRTKLISPNTFNYSLDEYILRCHDTANALKNSKLASKRFDVVVGHSGLGGTLYLSEIFDCPHVNYFEFFFLRDGYLNGFRSDSLFPSKRRYLSVANAVQLLNLENATLGYCPTNWQKSQFPAAYQSKLRVLHDGIDTNFWHSSGRNRRQLVVGNVTISPTTKLVTYVSRGFEQVRGFDVLMEFANRLTNARDDVIVVCVGEAKTFYGSSEERGDFASYKERLVAERGYGLERILFPGRVSLRDLRKLFWRSDLHVYLTEPFIMSWSPLQAMAAGCTLLCSDTEPVREFVRHGENGLLADFFDVDGLLAQAMEQLYAPNSAMAKEAESHIKTNYSLRKVLPHFAALLREASDRKKVR